MDFLNLMSQAESCIIKNYITAKYCNKFYMVEKSCFYLRFLTTQVQNLVYVLPKQNVTKSKVEKKKHRMSVKCSLYMSRKNVNLTNVNVDAICPKAVICKN